MPAKERKTATGPRGGVLYPQQKGDPALPGAGRKPNPFRKLIQDWSEDDQSIIVKGKLLDADGHATGEVVDVSVKMPGTLAVVLKAYKLAAKGDSQARKWLSETGFGKTINLEGLGGGDADNPLGGGGFVLVLPNNGR